ncbi:MAG: 50S ribosomal protein L6 [Deinococcota bacterium]
MSRIGRAPISLPKSVEVRTLSTDGPTQTLEVKGSKGSLVVTISSRIEVNIEDGSLSFSRPSDHRNDRAQHGLARSLVNNAVLGVSEGYTRNLEINGVGYRCAMKGKTLELQLGYSHPITFDPPEGITINTPEPTKITVTGIDKQLVGQVCANLRKIRPPDSYHGKGVRYAGEQIKLKPGKAASR